MVLHSSRLPLPSLLCAAVALSSLGIAQESAPANGGFLTGLRGFEHFHEPIGQPIYFESPLNDSGVRALYLRHKFANGSVLQGGDVTIYALQARLALTERLAFIATKDGYSELDTGIPSVVPDDEGWNDLAFGFKYVAIADKENDFVLTPGIRYMAENGSRRILQGGVDEFSPFVSFAKGFGNVHLVGNTTLRMPTNKNDGNTVGHWDLHLDYSINPKDDVVFAPVAEVHGVHYLSNGATDLPIGGLDYGNFGTRPDDKFVAWMGLGLRVEMWKKFEFGAVYEFALTDRNKDIMDNRVTVDFIARF